VACDSVTVMRVMKKSGNFKANTPFVIICNRLGQRPSESLTVTYLGTNEKPIFDFLVMFNRY